jgi:hypothetical protein
MSGSAHGLRNAFSHSGDGMPPGRLLGSTYQALEAPEKPISTAEWFHAGKRTPKCRFPMEAQKAVASIRQGNE